MVVHKTCYLLENVQSAFDQGNDVPYTANDSRGKILQLAKELQNLQNFSPSKYFPCTVCGTNTGLKS